MSGWKVWQRVGKVVGATAGLMLLTHCGGAEEQTGAQAQPQEAESSKQAASSDACQPVVRHSDIWVRATEDTYATASQPDATHGSEQLLLVDGAPQLEAYLRFQVDPYLLQDVTLTQARLQLFATDGSSDGPALYRTSGSWDASTLTWNTRPARVGSALGDLGTVANNTYVEYDVTSAISSAGTYDFALVPTGGNGVDFQSLESFASQPQLILTVARTYCARRGTGGDVTWGHSRGGENDQYLRAMAMDPQGGFVAAADYFHSGNFGGQPLTSPYGFALVKYAASGAHQWSRVYVQSNLDSQLAATDITLTPLGNILVVGAYQGAPDFGAGPLPYINGSNWGFFVAKFAPDGDPVWSHGFAASGEGNNIRAYAASVATDANGSLIVTGDFTGWLNLGGAELESGESFSQYGMFLAKFSWEGAHLWSLAVPAGTSNPWSDSTLGREVVTNAEGRIYVGGQAGTGRLGAISDSTPFVAAYSPEGTLLWSRALYDANGHVESLAVMPDGGVAFAGAFQGSFSFAGTTLTSLPDSAGWSTMDGLLGVLSPTGADTWAKALGSSSYDIIHRLDADPSGNLSFALHTNGQVDLGGGVLSHPTQSGYFLARFTSSGAHRWSRVLAPELIPMGLETSPDGGTVLGGVFDRPVTVDSTTYPAPGGNDELLFLKLAP
ncbi:CBM96 family carbohydrate-binding protein [Pyxidicoccus xibeiensis]|uniref:CBM96 family carbohydrate-binding protein n=1 Tax=Pyxidicoccus xibeiensis TaxID=2906759 RepID=UPI0020A81907|nr:DNRLRE domain-containing protein [Pyxidicoccus xibeiensis]MCP3138340.1 DNRLRE domain-containing protein [Pyxidicoccus xibeiensis]